MKLAKCTLTIQVNDTVYANINYSKAHVTGCNLHRVHSLTKYIGTPFIDYPLFTTLISSQLNKFGAKVITVEPRKLW